MIIDLDDIVGQYDDDDDIDIEITRTEFEHLIQPIILKMDECLKETIQIVNVLPNDISFVLLTGGLCRIPVIGKLFSAFNLRQSINPDKAIADGALYYLSTHSTN